MSDRASSPHPRRAAVPPVPAGTARPRWSVMIPTYHCADYLAHTLRSVLRQDLGPDAMQIEGRGRSLRARRSRACRARRRRRPCLVLPAAAERRPRQELQYVPAAQQGAARSCICFNRALLPPDRADAITSFATVDTAVTALRRSHRMLRAGETRGPLVQLREAVRLSRSPRVLAASAKLLAHWVLVHLRRGVRRVRSGPPPPTSLS